MPILLLVPAFLRPALGTLGVREGLLAIRLRAISSVLQLVVQRFDLLFELFNDSCLISGPCIATVSSATGVAVG